MNKQLYVNLLIFLSLLIQISACKNKTAQTNTLEKPLVEVASDSPSPTPLDSSEKASVKLAKMLSNGNTPLDFSELAEKRSKGELAKLSMTTKTYMLDLGGNATETDFISFTFEDGSFPLTAGCLKI